MDDSEERKPRYAEEQKRHQEQMEEEGRNVVRQLCFHTGLHTRLPKVRSYGYDRGCDCPVLSLTPGSALPRERGAPYCLGSRAGS